MVISSRRAVHRACRGHGLVRNEPCSTRGVRRGSWSLRLAALLALVAVIRVLGALPLLAPDRLVW